MPDPVDLGLFAVFGVVLAGPFLAKRIEENLEAFLFVMGVTAASISWAWSLELAGEALLEPILKGIVPAVLLAGLAFHYGRKRVDAFMKRLLERAPLRWIVFGMVVGLGLLSSVITAIIAALLLVEMVHFMPLDRRERTGVVIAACYSIGLGAALTPIGEPLSTIVVTKLAGAPYHADFLYLFNLLAVYIIPGVVAFGILGAYPVGRGTRRRKDEGGRMKAKSEKTKETLREVFVRVLKVYIFVMALILLGAGMKVVIDRYFTQVPAAALYWVNMVSAVLDNATLAAAEIGPTLLLPQIKGALMGLLISGGMLIPGNIPNIIAAHKLKISSREWARIGVPVGLAAMGIYFVWLYLVPVP